MFYRALDLQIIDNFCSYPIINIHKFLFVSKCIDVLTYLFSETKVVNIISLVSIFFLQKFLNI